MSDDSDQPRPVEIPDLEELDRIAVTARLRRAPRFGPILGTGIGGGFALGVILALVLPNATGVSRGMVALLTGLSLALLGGLIAGAIVTTADRHTPAYLREARRAEAAGDDTDKTPHDVPRADADDAVPEPPEGER